jgi:hypothetical protein
MDGPVDAHIRAEIGKIELVLVGGVGRPASLGISPIRHNNYVAYSWSCSTIEVGLFKVVGLSTLSAADDVG